ncbi:MAG: sulfite exporter TauE/SafE family protein [Pseudomonadota bacterium]
MSEFTLIPVALLTSVLAAIFGAGGGVPLIAVMPGLLPVDAIIPVHAATQLASNSSRAALGWRAVDWSVLPPFLAGGLIGAVTGAALFSQLDLRWLPPLMGVVILWLTWRPAPIVSGDGSVALLLLGFYQTGIGMLIGASGPLGAAVLARRGLARDGLVVNTAVYMSLNHGLRVGAFLALGFSFAPYAWLLLGLVLAVSLGSWLGTGLRQRLPEADFKRWFRWIMTLLALRLIASGCLL